MWRAAVDVGYDVRSLIEAMRQARPALNYRGRSSIGPSGCARSRSSCLPLIELYREAGTTGWLVAGVDEPAFAGAVAEQPVGVHAGAIADVPDTTVEGLDIRPIEPGEERRWAELFIAGFEIDGPLAEAWLRFEPSWRLPTATTR